MRTISVYDGSDGEKGTAALMCQGYMIMKSRRLQSKIYHYVLYINYKPLYHNKLFFFFFSYSFSFCSLFLITITIMCTMTMMMTMIMTVTMQRRQYGLKSVGSWTTWIRVNKISYFTGNLKKFRFFQANFWKNFDFFRPTFEKFRFSQENFWKIRFFQANFWKISIFSGNLKNLRFARQKLVIYSYAYGQIILFFFKSHNFRTYFMYMIRYNNISRLVYMGGDLGGTEGRSPKIWGVGGPMHPSLQYFEK